jgi:intron-binding protein aquarius
LCCLPDLQPACASLHCPPTPTYLQGELEPHAYFYQNLGEAEYLVSLYCFMRLMGYPAHKISILTTYNGQKHLLRDVVERRCAHHPLIGRPHRVS